AVRVAVLTGVDVSVAVLAGVFVIVAVRVAVLAGVDVSVAVLAGVFVIVAVRVAVSTGVAVRVAVFSGVLVMVAVAVAGTETVKHMASPLAPAFVLEGSRKITLRYDTAAGAVAESVNGPPRAPVTSMSVVIV